MPQSNLNKGWMTLVNWLAPGSPFNTQQGGGVGDAWRAGDYSQAAHGNHYAQGRIATGLIPGLGGVLGNGAINLLEKNNTNKYENGQGFVGPPRNYNSGSLPQGVNRQGAGTNEDPYTYGYDNPAAVGPPAPGQTKVPTFNKGNAQGKSTNFGNSVSPTDALNYSLLMGSLGFTGTTGTGPEDQAALWLRKLVK